jgi:phosphoribosylformimino-5-aminoimidazole carboxamide ribotide isomerase
MRFRPCIDLRSGKVVQLVGGTLNDAGAGTVTNFESERPASYFAGRYRRDELPGGHVIALGPGNESAMMAALMAFPGGFQVGGGMTPDNAGRFLDAGASHVIVTSYVFRDGRIDADRLDRLVRVTGRERLVLDLSCRRCEGGYRVVTDRWQTFTEVDVTPSALQSLAAFCNEFLVHGVDVEGLRMGIEAPLVELLGRHCPVPVTYAGGVRSVDDLEQVRQLGQGRVDVTIGSALDIFGGRVPYADVVAWHRVHAV